MASKGQPAHATKGELSESKKVDFHHPYTPYNIQEEFMQTVYNILENGNNGPDGNASVGILESPTGTGKSLSLICASLTWLRDFKRRQFEDELSGGREGKDEDEPEWVLEAARKRRSREMLRGREEMESRLRKAREKEAKLKRAMLKGGPGGFMGKKRRMEVGTESEKNGDDEQFVLDEYHSDGETARDGSDPYAGFSREIRALMEKNGLARKQHSEEDEEVEDEIKIFYCSRTHSQLTQFINEIRRVHIPPSLQPDPAPREPILEEEFKHLTLGSRKNLCINPAVNKLRSTTAINERCSDLQQPSTSKEKRCHFLPNQENVPLVHDFRDRTLATVRDIEELGALGKEVGICPYYASRSAIKPAEIVTLPYPLLLQKSAREALGVSVKGHVIIVDEAHNLMDAIAGIYGVSVSLSQLRKSRAQLQAYILRFRARLAGKNRVYVAQVVRLIDSLAKYLETQEGKPEDVVVMADMMAGKGVDQINIYKLLRYLQKSKLARKVEGYILLTENGEKEAIAVRKTKAQVTNVDASESAAPTLHHVSSFFYALTNPDKEGRLFHTYDPVTQETSLKYMLLDPTHHFQEIASEARAVILAGGTMSPMSDYTSHLLAYLSKEKITTLSCGHIIPKENLLAWTLSSGPTGKPFEFTFARRKGREGEEMIDELGRVLINLCLVVPDGLIVFFPSYAYLDTAVKRWEVVLELGTPCIWERLGKKKAIFRESKDAKAGEDILSAYATAIDTNKGGLLLSVVGGKMSEGINFSDRLGRCVVIVGLPFPNIMSGEWKAKMTYIESSTVARMEAAGEGTEGSRMAKGKNEAKEFYENACMRAVNQSVGRAIRHREDFAAIVMIDVRFGRDNIKGKLPGWIRSGLQEGCEDKPFSELMGGLSKFFRGKKMAQ